MLAGRIVDATTLPVYDLGLHHPFARDRQRPLFDLLRRSGLLTDADVLPTTPCNDAELESAHSRQYLQALAATSVPQPDAEALRLGARFGLGSPDNPIAPGQYEAAAAIAGATRASVRAVLEGHCRAAFNPAGGLHHAMPQQAAGFCLVNDLVVGIRHARAAGVDRVLYVDFDVHHGDGVERAFWRDASVLTLSFHETPEVRYPGTGFVHDLGEADGHGYALNVPLHPGTDDDSFTACVQAVLPVVARAFAPGLIVSQHGCDTHRDDPLATIDCTTASMHDAARLCRSLADELCSGRWVATGGGGYQPYTVIPRAWAMVWSALSGKALPDAIDEGWRRQWQERSGGAMPRAWRDEAQGSPHAARAAEQNQKTVARLLGSLDWL